MKKHGFHYITAITKAQIETLIKKNIVPYTLFDDKLVEIEHEGVRYILRRNPIRAAEIIRSRASKQKSVERFGKSSKHLSPRPS